MCVLGLMLLVLPVYGSGRGWGWEVRARVRVLGTIVLVGMLSFGGGGIYVVRAGDTLGAIARRAGASVASLVRANGLRDADVIRIGQRLTIPGADGDPAGAAAPPGTYTVRRGDTLAAIAQRTGVPAAVIAAANGLVGPTLYAGARLRLAPLTGSGGEVLHGPDVHAGNGVHTVGRGETLGAIAARSGTSVASIVRANGLRSANYIRIGQRLTIPGAGTWQCPLVGTYRYVNDWGFPREGGRAHEGIDLFADRGTPVVAPVAGVATQKVGSIGGRQVTLRGDDGFVYVNSHLNSFAKAGRVAPGDLIGRIGTSGDAAGGPPHLHFEIHPGGIGPINPYPTIKAVCRA
jgi:LysM repeat protein